MFHFPKELQADFRRDYAYNALPQVRVAIILGAMLFCGFIIWDRMIDPIQYYKALFIRIPITIFIVLHLPLSYTKWFRQWFQFIASITATIVGIGMISVLYSLENGLSQGIGGLLLVFMYIHGLLRLWFIPSVIAGIAILIVYNFVSIFLAHREITFLISNNFFLFSGAIVGATVSYLLERQFRRIYIAEHELEIERKNSDIEKAKFQTLLLSVFPEDIVSRLNSGEEIIADSHGEVTVLFADIVDFSKLTLRLSPSHLVELLDRIFSKFDSIVDHLNLEKIKTIGDCYMIVDALSHGRKPNTIAVAECAIQMLEVAKEVTNEAGVSLELRIGIGTGQAISGVLGRKRPHFDLWGDTVNLASRMMSFGKPGQIQVSESTYWRLQRQYKFEDQGEIEVKGIGFVRAYILIGKK